MGDGQGDMMSRGRGRDRGLSLLLFLSQASFLSTWWHKRLLKHRER